VRITVVLLIGNLPLKGGVYVSAGLSQSVVTFKVPVQKTYSVRGIISTNDKSELDARDVSVALVSLDGGPSPSWYNQTIDFRGSFPPPKVKYFDFENVLRGRAEERFPGKPARGAKGAPRLRVPTLRATKPISGKE
jgi:hypothetical protein